MQWALLVPVVLGIFSVMQAALNREMARDWGLSGAVLLNSLVFLVVGAGIYAWVRLLPAQWPEFMRDRGAFQSWHAWFLLPGLFGFGIVLGLPFALSKVGAYKVFVLLIAAQMLTSLVWDVVVSDLKITTVRLLGAALLVAGVALVTLRE